MASDLRSGHSVACSLGVDRIEQIDRWRSLLVGVEPKKTVGGAEYVLPIGRVEHAVRVAVDEQACCPFFSFDLALQGEAFVPTIRTPPEGAGMLAEITGRSGVATAG